MTVLTPEVLVASTNFPLPHHLRCRPTSSSVHSLLRLLTHLKLDGKKIRKIESLDRCANLQVLYLYDNDITRIENLSNLKNLKFLYLQNNKISEIENLEALPNLEKFNISENRISILKALQNCPQLSNLSLQQQQKRPFSSSSTFCYLSRPLLFEIDTLHALSSSLEVLDVSSNFLSDLSPLRFLLSLRQLTACNNLLQDIASISPVLRHCVLLEVLLLQGNPITKLTDYRRQLILHSSDALRILNDKTIHSNAHRFVAELHKRRQNRKRVNHTAAEAKSYVRSSSTTEGGGEKEQQDAMMMRLLSEPITTTSGKEMETSKGEEETENSDFSKDFGENTSEKSEKFDLQSIPTHRLYMEETARKKESALTNFETNKLSPPPTVVSLKSKTHMSSTRLLSQLPQKEKLRSSYSFPQKCPQSHIPTSPPRYPILDDISSHRSTTISSNQIHPVLKIIQLNFDRSITRRD